MPVRSNASKVQGPVLKELVDLYHKNMILDLIILAKFVPKGNSDGEGTESFQYVNVGDLDRVIGMLERVKMELIMELELGDPLDEE